MASKELELTQNVYIFAGVGALLLGGLGAWAFSGNVAGIVSPAIIGGLAGGVLGLFF